MAQYFSLHELALCSGYSERMLRKYMKDGLLVGTLINRKWQFNEEQVTAFLDNPIIKDGLKIKQLASVVHFMNDYNESKNESCFIFDRKGSIDEIEIIKNKILEYFQENDNINGSFSYFYDDSKELGRFIFFGTMTQIRKFLEIIDV